MAQNLFRILFLIITCSYICDAQQVTTDEKHFTIPEIDNVLDSLSNKIVINTDRVNHLLESSERLGYTEGIITCHNLLGEYYFHIDSFKAGQFHFEKKYKITQLVGDRYEESMTLGQMASILSAQEKLPSALEKAKLQLEIAKELNDSSLISGSYLSLSEIYNMASDYNAEVKYLNLAINYHVHTTIDYTKGYLYTVLGSVYLSKGEIENSYKHFELADQSFKSMETLDNYDHAYYNIYYGQLLLEDNKPKLAVEYCKKAKTYFSSTGSKNMTAECLACLLLGYGMLNETFQEERTLDTFEILLQDYESNYMSYVFHRTKYENYDFSMFPKQQAIVENYVNSFEDLTLDENRALIYQTQKQIELKESEDKLLLTEAKLQKKQVERNLYLLVAALILLLSIFFLFQFINERRIKKKSIEIFRLKERQKSIELAEKLKQNEFLSQKLDDSERGVTIKSTIIREFNSKLEDIKSELSKIDFKNLPDNQKTLRNIIRKLDAELESEDSFIDFLDHFNTVYPHFFENIQEQFPKLNIHDKKLCAYIKMNLESTEIADLLHINRSSVNTARYRLRKKLNLTKSDDLNYYIQNL